MNFHWAQIRGLQQSFAFAFDLSISMERGVGRWIPYIGLVS